MTKQLLSLFLLFLQNQKNITNMKKFIVIMGIVFTSVIICTSCKPRQKCPSYGNYTYYEIVDTAEQES